MQTLAADSEVYRENRSVIVDGITVATARDQSRAAEIVAAMQAGQKSSAAQEYVLTAINGFKGDPADTDYQRGYLAALECVAREAFGIVLVDRAA